MRGNNAPKLGVRYPFKIGKSLKAPSSARDMLALKFMNIPEKAALFRPGTLSRNADKCLVQLPTADGSSSVHFSGTRRTQPDASVHDYVLVFVDGKIWLERTADYFYSIRPLDTAKTSRPPPDYPTPMHEDDGPDSWDPESASPITPEDDLPMDSEFPAAPAPGTAGKSTPPMSARHTTSRGMRISAGKVNVARPTHPTPTPGTAAKSVATKSLAGKSLSNANGHLGRRRPADDDDDDDDDRASDASSSDDDDSDDSDSDSDSDDYTDRSSDEE